MNQISVDVTTAYVESQSCPEENHFVFTYSIRIRNTGSVAARLLNRHWIITDANGKVQEVVGEGVVGKQPTIAPMEQYRYTSGVVLSSPVGTMEGHYGMEWSDGQAFNAPIPAFLLSVPNAIN